MTWDTRIVNNHSTDITVNDTNLGSGASTVLSGVNDVVVAVSSIGTVRLTEPGADDFHQYISTTWAVKVVASDNAYVRYWGYEGRPTLVLAINEDDTFTLPDQNNTSFDHIPISRPPLAQYAGQYDTNTQWWGGFFSPLIINQDGTVSSTVSLDWTKFKDTSFKTWFSLTGTGQNISFAGDLSPRPQDGGTHFTGSLSTNQADAFHLHVLKYEFPLYFDASGRRPLSFRGPGALACNTNNSPSSLDFFRLAPLDAMDRIKGYRLWCNGFYAGTADTMWQGDRCISGTKDTSKAIVFKPNLTSSKLFKLGAPD
ncbi:hypothetical protein CC80DRAFT_545581 [Byssothecium circinans]|uniref:Uncharacterized protein n=1 Tax=Byssothecium circinans TaxID=147558 RepID=A0A6A5U3H2_9PLEO|nr:hypothetical protein CC80DRAFT_545581 [Byssothecium circinans]